LLGAKPITQFHLLPKRAFWEDDGLSPAMWTDGLAGSILVNRDGANPAQVTTLTAWCSARTARYLDRFPQTEAGRLVIAEIERLRPAAPVRRRHLGNLRTWAGQSIRAQHVCAARAALLLRRTHGHRFARHGSGARVGRASESRSTRCLVTDSTSAKVRDDLSRE
jgi:hypothetical protein